MTPPLTDESPRLLAALLVSETHDISEAGVAALTAYLRERGRFVAPSDRKTFDLIVDGTYAEVKAKSRPYAEFDFIGLTDNQYHALEGGEDFILFIVCNVANPQDLEVFEMKSSELRTLNLKTECYHYLHRAELDRAVTLRGNTQPLDSQTSTVRSSDGLQGKC